MTQAINFEQAKQQAEMAREQSKVLGQALRNFPRAANGLVPDHVKFSEPYRQAKALYDQAFEKERRANDYLVKNFKKELQQERKEKNAQRSVTLGHQHDLVDQQKQTILDGGYVNTDDWGVLVFSFDLERSVDRQGDPMGIDDFVASADRVIEMALHLPSYAAPKDPDVNAFWERLKQSPKMHETIKAGAVAFLAKLPESPEQRASCLEFLKDLSEFKTGKRWPSPNLDGCLFCAESRAGTQSEIIAQELRDIGQDQSGGLDQRTVERPRQ